MTYDEFDGGKPNQQARNAAFLEAMRSQHYRLALAIARPWVPSDATAAERMAWGRRRRMVRALAADAVDGPEKRLRNPC